MELETPLFDSLLVVQGYTGPTLWRIYAALGNILRGHAQVICFCGYGHGKSTLHGIMKRLGCPPDTVFSHSVPPARALYPQYDLPGRMDNITWPLHMEGPVPETLIPVLIVQCRHCLSAPFVNPAIEWNTRAEDANIRRKLLAFAEHLSTTCRLPAAGEMQLSMPLVSRDLSWFRLTEQLPPLGLSFSDVRNALPMLPVELQELVWSRCLTTETRLVHYEILFEQ